MNDPGVVALIDRLTRENVELAGRCGWLQSENQRLTETIRQLQAPASHMCETPTMSTSYGSAEHQNGPDSSVQSPSSAEIAPERPSDAQNSRVSGEVTTHRRPGSRTGQSAAVVALLEARGAAGLMPWVICVTEPGRIPVRSIRTDYHEEAERFAERVRESARRNERNLIVVTVEWEEPPA